MFDCNIGCKHFGSIEACLDSHVELAFRGAGLVLARLLQEGSGACWTGRMRSARCELCQSNRRLLM